MQNTKMKTETFLKILLVMGVLFDEKSGMQDVLFSLEEKKIMESIIKKVIAQI